MFEVPQSDDSSACGEGTPTVAALRRAEWETGLVELGPLVCLHRREDFECLQEDALPLLDWNRARALSEVDSDGPRDALRFHGPDGAVVLQLCLLPDSDFLAWERLLQRLPRAQTPTTPLCRPSWLAWLRWRARMGRFVVWKGRLRFEPWAAMSPCGERSADGWSARCHCGPCQR